MGEGSSTLCMLLQLSTANGGRVVSSTFHFQRKSYQWGKGPPHCTCNSNFQLPMGEGSSTLQMQLQLSTADGEGESGSSTFHIQTVTSMGGWDLSHFTSKVTSFGGWMGHICHISQLFSHIMGVGGWYLPHFTSNQSHIIWGWGILHISPTKLNAPQQWNQTDFHHYVPAQHKTVLWLYYAYSYLSLQMANMCTLVTDISVIIVLFFSFTSYVFQMLLSNYLYRNHEDNDNFLYREYIYCSLVNVVTL